MISCVSCYILLIGVHMFVLTNGEDKLETSCNVHGDRALQQVSEKFLSISIDPAVLLAGLNLSDSSLLLAQHLSPAYIRIAGPSTKFVRYQDNEDRSPDRPLDDGNSVVVTPSMWFGINEWLRLANLTPVFGINDVETTRGVWNPKSTLPLLEISDKLNVSCLWQLGFDSSPKTETQYKQDLNILYHFLGAFSDRNETWKIVGSDISTLPKDQIENTMEKLKDIVTAVMWEPQTVTEGSFPEKDMGWTILSQQQKPNAKLWTSVPKSTEPISFLSALVWAMQMGEAAKFGYEVVFRQPRLHEIFSDSPAYWVSLLHKKLMGSNVLNATQTIYYPGSAAYAHCTRRHDESQAEGSLTVMVVNNNIQKYKAKVRLGKTPLEKNMLVQCYTLTSAENSTDVYLNGKKLTMDRLSKPDIFKPKLRRTRTKSYISLEVPPKSIGFFVVPDAKIPVCINEEKRVNNHIQEVIEEQDTPLSKENILGLTSRGLFVKNPTLREITQRMKKEMESDEKYYSSNWELENVKKETDSRETKPSSGKSLYEKARFAAKERKRLDLEKRKDELKKFLSEKNKVAKPEARIQVKQKNLELTSTEVERILKDRAKARAAQRNIIFTDEELEALLQKASKQFASKSRFERSVPEDDCRQKRAIKMETLDKASLSSGEGSIEDDLEFFGTNQRSSSNIQKRSARTPRDINTRLLEIRSKLAENRQRIEDKKYEILGNTQTIKENIMDKIRNLKHKNRYRRDINMDLLKIKTDGQKRAVQKNDERKPMKSLFKNKENKEATIREPGQTSAELLEELEEEEEVPIEKNMPKIEVFAELADPEDELDEEVDFFSKGKKLGRFDKKSNDPFSITNPTSRTTRKKKKEKNALQETLQFLTTSEEFSDIEDDLPCIHEFFGSDFNGAVGDKHKKIKPELGEVLTDRTAKKGKQGSRKTTELTDVMMSSEKDPFEEIRIRRDDVKIQCGNSFIGDGKDLDDFRGEEKDMMKSGSQSLENHGPSGSDPMSTEYSSGTKFSQNDDALIKRPIASNKAMESFKKNSSDSSKSQLSNDDDIDSTSSETVKLTGTKNELQSLRRKRNADENLDAETDKIELKKRIAAIKKLIKSDKLKFEEEKRRNKIKLAYMKTQQQAAIADDKDILEEIHQIEHAKTNQILKQLQLLQKILIHRRKELDKCFLNDGDALSQARMEERTHSKLKDQQKILTTLYEDSRTQMEREELPIVQNKKETTNPEHKRLPLIDMEKETNIPSSRIPEKLPETQGIQNVSPPAFDMNEKKLPSLRIHDSSPTAIHLSRRSLFDKYPGGFGNYKSLTANLKPWRPSDILSMKRDSSLITSRNLKPTNDYQIYTNMFDKNKFLRKRSINGNLIDLDNHIYKDSDFDIDRKYTYSKPSDSSNVEGKYQDGFDEVFINADEGRKYMPSKITKEEEDYTNSLFDENKDIRDKEGIETIVKGINDVQRENKYELNENKEKEHMRVTMTEEGNIKYLQPEIITDSNINVNNIKNADNDDIKEYVQLNVLTGNTGFISASNNSNDLNEGKNGDKNTSTFEVTDTQVVYPTATTVDPIIYYTFHYDFEPESESGDVANSTAEAEIVDQKVHDIVGSFIGNVSGFFKNVGSQIGHYFNRLIVF